MKLETWLISKHRQHHRPLKLKWVPIFLQILLDCFLTYNGLTPFSIANYLQKLFLDEILFLENWLRVKMLSYREDKTETNYINEEVDQPFDSVTDMNGILSTINEINSILLISWRGLRFYDSIQLHVF